MPHQPQTLNQPIDRTLIDSLYPGLRDAVRTAVAAGATRAMILQTTTEGGAPRLGIRTSPTRRAVEALLDEVESERRTETGVGD